MAETIVSIIKSEAAKIVNSTLEEGNLKAQEIIESARNEVSRYRESNMAQTYAMRDEVLKRRESVARLEVKKVLLAARKSVLDTAFCNAKEMLAKLNDKDYLAIISGMLAYAAEDGDVVSISEKDKDRITKEYIDSESTKLGVKLELGSYADIDGGIILSNGLLSKNLSLAVELDALREDIEPAVAAKLGRL